MNFRIEKKYRIISSNLNEFFKWLHSNNFKEIHKKRLISSIYYDNVNLSMYNDSLEGVIPRKKIRIRSYDQVKKFYKEEKLTTQEGEFKDSKKINFLENHKILIDKDYGVCNKILTIMYNRQYFLKENIRVTIDTDINYQKINSDMLFSDDQKFNTCVIEFKTSKIDDFNNIKDKIPLDEIRFSKYSNGIECLKNNFFLTF